MSIFDHIDFTHGELPGWLNNLVALTRPLAMTMTVAIAPMGAFMCGLVAFFSPPRGEAMASASIRFLQGIPDAGYGAIVAIALGYTAVKSAEAVKAMSSAAKTTDPDALPPEPQIFNTSKLEIPHPDFAPNPAQVRATEIME